MKLVNDIYTLPSSNEKGTRYCFTDGVGKMSCEFADEVCRVLNEAEASAFQVIPSLHQLLTFH